MTTYFTYLDTPIGTLLLAGDGQVITRIGFARGGAPERPGGDWIRDDARLEDASTQLLEYFAGNRRDFTLPLRPEGTEFQRKVWKTLLDIPFGETRSYGWLAMAIGNPAASRAVGAANGANPIPVLIPCHRVIRGDGSLSSLICTHRAPPAH